MYINTLAVLAVLGAVASAAPQKAPQKGPPPKGPTSLHATNSTTPFPKSFADANGNSWGMNTWTGTSCQGNELWWSVPNGFSCTNLRQCCFSFPYLLEFPIL